MGIRADVTTTAGNRPTPSAKGIARYANWIERQPLAPRTRDSYLSQVRQYLQWLATQDNHEELLPDHTRDAAQLGWGPAARAGQARRQGERSKVAWAAGEYKHWMLTERLLAPRTVNQALAAVRNLYQSRGLAVSVSPAAVPRQAPKALAPKQVKALRREVAALPPRDRAIILTLLHTGIRRGELAALRTGDVAMTDRKGYLTVRSGKGRRSRTVPLNAECRRALGAWITDRARWPIRDADTADALWLSRLGHQASPKALGAVVSKVGRSAGLERLTPHTLRHTFVTRLVRGGIDPFLVADLAGHARLETTMLYSLPTDDDRRTAVEGLTGH